MIPIGGFGSLGRVDFYAPDQLHPVQRHTDQGTAFDYERGGIALNDASAGFDVQDWQFSLVNDEARVGKIGEVPVTIWSASGMTEISGSFDSGMQACVAYVQAGVVRLYYFDTLTLSMTTIDIPGAASPRLTLDDKRPTQSNARDILLLYLKGASLCYRQQRDRYEIERILAPMPDALRLGRVGMGSNRRVNVEVLTRGMTELTGMHRVACV